MIGVSRRRLVVLYVVLAALLAGLGARAWFLQVTSHGSYVAQANADRIRDIVQPPVRGEIVAARHLIYEPDGALISLPVATLVMDDPAPLLAGLAKGKEPDYRKVAWLGARLRPVASPDPARVARLVADLDDDDCAVRQRASAELGQLGARDRLGIRFGLRLGRRRRGGRTGA